MHGVFGSWNPPAPCSASLWLPSFCLVPELAREACPHIPAETFHLHQENRDRTVRTFSLSPSACTPARTPLCAFLPAVSKVNWTMNTCRCTTTHVLRVLCGFKLLFLSPPILIRLVSGMDLVRVSNFKLGLELLDGLLNDAWHINDLQLWNLNVLGHLVDFLIDDGLLCFNRVDDVLDMHVKMLT